MLKEAAPRLARIGVVFNSEFLSAAVSSYLALIEAAAPGLSLHVITIPYRNPIDIVRAVDALAAEPNSGLLVLPPAPSPANLDTMLRLAAQYRLPTIFSSRFHAAAGGLMAYGSDGTDQSHRAAIYVDRILRGAKVTDLPVQFPTKYELVINLRTAKEIGLTIPEAFLLRADELIE